MDIQRIRDLNLAGPLSKAARHAAFMLKALFMATVVIPGSLAVLIAFFASWQGRGAAELPYQVFSMVAGLQQLATGYEVKSGEILVEVCNAPPVERNDYVLPSPVCKDGEWKAEAVPVHTLAEAKGKILLGMYLIVFLISFGLYLVIFPPRERGCRRGEPQEA